MSQYQNNLLKLLSNILEEESLSQSPQQSMCVQCLRLPFEFDDVVIHQANGVSMLLERCQLIQRVEEHIFRMPDLGINSKDVYQYSFEDLCGLLSFLQREREEREGQ